MSTAHKPAAHLHTKEAAQHLTQLLSQITAQLAEAAGIDPRSLDESRLRWIVEARCRALHLADPGLYAERLRAAPEEIDRLIEETTVGETRFFRDPAVFEHLRGWLPQLAAGVSGDLHVLSAPCSTGQEAYSLAATCTLAGIVPSRVRIDAFDISAAALAVARHGQYAEDSLKRLTPEQQQACGTLHHGHWKIHEPLRRSIHFERRNLAAPAALENSKPYHLILCRNLFIYLRPEARRALAQSLAAALAPGGRLILGSADRVEEISELFSPLKPAASFAFTHRTAVSAVAPVHRSAARPRVQHAPDFKPKPIPHPAAVPPSLTTTEGLYKRALEHQQHGELRRAERRCRQALYLDPRYLPALELLEQLWSQHPNLRLRRALQARILRHRVGAENIGTVPGSWMETA